MLFSLIFFSNSSNNSLIGSFIISASMYVKFCKKNIYIFNFDEKIGEPIFLYIYFGIQQFICSGYLKFKFNKI